MRYEISEVVKKRPGYGIGFLVTAVRPRDLLGLTFYLTRTGYLCLSSRCGKDGSCFRGW